ncbi:MAG: ABC transporter permease [Acidimicrobiia bacterium]|nr:ABC transporter permease [Acidimicrobiia bacterium]MYF25862.1 ABC transporter permease [Acidimicrobiia bacterium]MYH55409.1 ABC transporter permease [Acidimicrobiia bacterium]
MLRNRLLLFGTVLGLIVLGAAFVGPTISGADPNLQNFSATHLPPGSEGNLLGTDHLGRDQAVRVFIGIRVSLMVAAGVTLISLALGLVLGMFAGFLGGWRDRTIRGVVDFVWGFPLILVAVLFAGGLGEGLFPVILAVGLVNTAAIARVVRGEVLSLSEREFVEAARAGGLSTPRIMWRHLFPNILAPALVLASYYVAVAIIAEAALSFIGLGAQPPTPSLGGMVSDGRNFLHINPWASTIPGVTIVLLVLSVSLIGDGLRDVFDPRLRHEAKGVEQE